MTAPTVDVAAALDRHQAVLRELSDVELERRAVMVAALPELRRLVDAERESRRAARRSRVTLVAAGTAVVGGPVALLAGRAMGGHVVLPEQMVYAPGAALALVGAVVAGQRIARWVDERRHPLAVDVADVDLDAGALALLDRVRAKRRARGEVV